MKSMPRRRSRYTWVMPATAKARVMKIMPMLLVQKATLAEVASYSLRPVRLGSA